MSAEDHDMKLITGAVESLGEHFDAVQIFASRGEVDRGDQIAVNVYSGCGNWFARYGKVSNWIVAEDERTKARIRLESLDEEDTE